MLKSEVKHKIEEFAKEWNRIKIYTTDREKDIENLIEELDIPYEYKCDICADTGSVDVYEAVYSNEPHQAPTGKETCICRLDLDGDNY